MLVRVSLGPRPWLHHLRRQLPGFVRWLRSYYGGVRLLLIVHRRLWLLAFPPRTIRPVGPMANPEISRFPHKERARMPGSATTPGRPSARVGALGHVAFRYTDSVGARDSFSIAALSTAERFRAAAPEQKSAILPFRRARRRDDRPAELVGVARPGGRRVQMAVMVSCSRVRCRRDRPSLCLAEGPAAVGPSTA